jgi:threonylcarbamoyladenosine tRNA methylthiotransferase MtaB
MKIFLDTIGCRLNQSEIEKFASQFRAAGHAIVSDRAEADLVVINTCAVTAEAASDSRQKIRQAYRAGLKEIIVTGCWASLEPRIAASMPGVSRVVANPDKDRLVPDLLNLPIEEFDLEPVARKPLPGAHQRTRAFIKVQDGCDNHCTFCITRVARGAGRSRSIRDVLKDVRAAVEGGAKEIVFTGVHLGSWGQDFGEPQHLRHLILAALADADIPRLRLSSLEPWDLDEKFFSLWEDPRLCKYLHLPLQSGCDATLRRMARKVTPHSFAHLVDLARAVDPEMSITTDVIVGFPGETEEEFKESLAFVESMNFAAGHVFHYSSRPGTPAVRLPGQVQAAVQKERSAAMRSLLAQCSRNYRGHFLGQTVQVLWEGSQSANGQGYQVEGLTGNYLRVSALSPQPCWNQVDAVRLEELTPEGLKGSILG